MPKEVQEELKLTHCLLEKVEVFSIDPVNKILLEDCFLLYVRFLALCVHYLSGVQSDCAAYEYERKVFEMQRGRLRESVQEDGLQV